MVPEFCEPFVIHFSSFIADSSLSWWILNFAKQQQVHTYPIGIHGSHHLSAPQHSSWPVLPGPTGLLQYLHLPQPLSVVYT